MKRFSAGLVLMLLCTFSIFAQNKVITAHPQFLGGNYL